MRLSTEDAPLFVDALEEMRVEAKRKEASRHGYRGARVEVATRTTSDPVEELEAGEDPAVGEDSMTSD